MSKMGQYVLDCQIAEDEDEAKRMQWLRFQAESPLFDSYTPQQKQEQDEQAPPF